MAAGHALKRGTATPGNRHERIFSAAVTGKQRHSFLQGGKKDRGSLAAESAGRFALADGRFELFHELANILGTARPDIFADCFDFAGSRVCAEHDHAAGRHIRATIGAGGIDEEALDSRGNRLSLVERVPDLVLTVA
jgi:hypothetical protein